MKQRTEWCWRAWLVGGAVGLVGAVVLLTLVLHGANLYPRFRAVAENEQRNGAYVWQTTCGEGQIYQPEALVQCERARQMAQLNVRSVALEHTLEHLLRELERGLTSRLFNPFALFACASGSSCHYVLFKCLDMLVSSTLLLVVAAVVVVLALCYGLWRGPLRTFAELHAQRAQRELVQTQLLLAANTKGLLGATPIDLYPQPQQQLRKRLPEGEGEVSEA